MNVINFLWSRCAVFTVCFFLLSSWGLSAQETVTTSGVIKDAEGLPLPGVNVIVQGSARGVSTDFEGKYSITVSTGDKIVFSAMGKRSVVKVALDGTMDLILEDDAEVLGEIVLSALGIEEKKDESGASTTAVATDLVEKSGETGLIQALSGKASGLKITRNSGDPGAGAFMQIRGAKTITGNTQPLIVVDGVPIDNSSTNVGGTGGVAGQSRLNDINFADVSDVQILKGAAAAALWGTRAANGVIVIKTKSGLISGGDAVSGSFSASVSFDQVNREFDKQDVYGQGTNGKFKANNGYSWGDKISDRKNAKDVLIKDPNEKNYNGYFEASDGTKYYAIKEKGRETYNQKNRDQIFRTAVTTEVNGSVSVSKSGYNMFVSIGDLRQEGVIKGNSDYTRNTFRFNSSGTFFDDKVKIKLNASYTKSSANRLQQGSNLSGVYLGYLRTSPDYDNADYGGTYYNKNGDRFLHAHRGYRRYLGNGVPTYNNPGFTINEQVSITDVQRFIIAPELKIDIATGTFAIFRYGLDYATDDLTAYLPANQSSYPGGLLGEGNTSKTVHNINAFVKTSQDINDDISAGLTAGIQSTDVKEVRIEATGLKFLLPIDPPYNFSNFLAKNISVDDYTGQDRTIGVYAVLDMDLYDQLFVELTGRGDRSSTFKGYIFYPSATVAWQLSKVLPEGYSRISVGGDDVDLLSFIKLRASYGQVGVQPGRYLTKTNYVSLDPTAGWGGYYNSSNYGGAFALSSTRGNPDLKPETTTEFEIGTDMRFWNDRFNLGFTYYNSKTEDVIFALDLPPSTGHTSTSRNAGKISNYGLEMDLSGKVFEYDFDGDRRSDITVRLNANFAMNRSKVEDLAGVESKLLAGFTSTSSGQWKGIKCLCFGVVNLKGRMTERLI